MESRVVTLPVHVNVVPGDQSAGRIEDPEVRTELTFQRAQRAKREATDALRDGDADRARRLYRESSDSLRMASRAASPEAARELTGEAQLLDDLAERTEYDAMSVRKQARADYHMKARRRRPPASGGRPR